MSKPREEWEEEETHVLKTVFHQDPTRRIGSALKRRRRMVLEVYGPDGELMEIVPLPESGVVRIGRGSDQDVRLSDLTVSRAHAIIKCEKGQYFLKDVGSLNATLLNDERITGEEPLFEGARIGIGMHILIVATH